MKGDIDLNIQLSLTSQSSSLPVSKDVDSGWKDLIFLCRCLCPPGPHVLTVGVNLICDQSHLLLTRTTWCKVRTEGKQ